MGRSPNPVDKHVGSRIRTRRLLVGLSQEKLGEGLGITFQQVQKYERGTNRISASRLQQASRVLGVPVAYFYEGVPPIDGTQTGGADGATAKLARSMPEPLTTRVREPSTSLSFTK